MPSLPARSRLPMSPWRRDIHFRDLMQAMDEHDVYSRFRFTNFDGRYLMSGTFRDWYLLACQLYADDQKRVMARCGFDIVNESVGHVLDNFLDKTDRP